MALLQQWFSHFTEMIIAPPLGLFDRSREQWLFRDQ